MVLLFCSGVITDAKNIVNRYIVQGRKFDKNISRDISLPQFIIAIYLLRTIQFAGNLFLRQVMIFAQIANSTKDIITFFFFVYQYIIYYRILQY